MNYSFDSEDHLVSAIEPCLVFCCTGCRTGTEPKTGTDPAFFAGTEPKPELELNQKKK